MTTRAAIPDAWPLLMTIEQTLAYVGGMDERTFRKICPVSAVALGANILRYNRQQIDAWAATLLPRLPRAHAAVNDVLPPTGLEEPQSADDRRNAAIERARARAKGAGQCRRKT